MSTRTLQLNLAHRNLLAALLQQYTALTELNLDDTIFQADISEALGLDVVSELVDAINLECQRAYVAAVREADKIRQQITAWEKKHEGEVVPDELVEELYAAEDKARTKPQAVNYKYLLKTVSEEYELDSKDLDWLINKFTEHKWNHRLVRDAQGAYSTNTVPLTADEAKAIRSLRDIFKAAVL